MRRLSISEITTLDWDFEQDVRGYQSAGIQGIGVWWQKLKAYGLEKGVSLLAETGLGVSSLIATGYYTLDTGARPPSCINDPAEAVEVAAALKADCLAVVAGPMIHQSAGESLAFATDRIRELVSLAERKSVRVALEPLHPVYTGSVSVVNTLAGALAVVKTIGSPALGLFLDTYHIWWDTNLDTLIPKTRGRIFGVHVSDWREPPRSLHTDRAMLGEGIIPLRHILGLIEGAGYGGYYEVEILSEDLWRSDYQQLLARCRSSFEALWP